MRISTPFAIWAMKKPCLFRVYSIVDYTTQVYRNYFINHNIRIPVKHNQDLMESKAGFFRGSVEVGLLQQDFKKRLFWKLRPRDQLAGWKRFLKAVALFRVEIAVDIQYIYTPGTLNKHGVNDCFNWMTNQIIT